MLVELPGRTLARGTLYDTLTGHPMSEDDDLPQLLSGRYRLEATLGHGGMGVVYRGVDLMMKRPIAVKLIRAVDGVELDDEIAGRFLREAKNTARLQHRHIIEVFDLGRTDEGGLYFVMELLDGESLSTRLRREGALSPERTVHIGRQICEALSVAHAAGIIHRDLKPANVMLLSRAGDDEFVKVLDFGVAKSYSSDQDTQLTHTGTLVGTVDYMAPEQIMGKPVDGRADVYSLGIVLYKMLSGKAPFSDTGGVPALIHAHLNTMPKPLIEVASGIPNELDRVVLRCLAKNPDRRYESMGELARALTAAILPDDVDLVSVQYGGGGDSDPYSAEDQTVMGRAYSDRPPPPDDATMSDGAQDVIFDDPTLRMDRRPLGFKKRPSPAGSTAATPREGRAAARGLAATPREGRAAAPGTAATPREGHAAARGTATTPREGRVAVRGTSEAQPALDNGVPPFGGVPDPIVLGAPPAYPEDISTTKRPLPDVITRRERTEPRTCVACQTVNASHAAACITCGISLATAEQEALRTRGGTVLLRSGSTPAPPLTPPNLGMHDMTGPPMHPGAPYVPPMPGVPAVQWLPHQPPPQPPPPPRTMWERFLSWTGLRSRQ